MNEILTPVLIVAGIGLLSGLILAVASIVMAVPKDEKAEAIREMLPGANCGACGFSGCDGYAKAMSSGEAKPGLCTVGGEAVAKTISEYIGCDTGEVAKKVALVHCLGSYDNTSDKVEYQGIETCAGAAIVAGGIASCQYGCMGIGDCMRACQYDAISICNGVARIDPSRCKGCSMCVKACPKHLISFVTANQQAVVRCSNCDKGALTNKVCKIGCIGCMKCEKTCQYDAVHVVNFLAVVDPSKCVGCGECVDICPRHCITMFNPGI
jgi:RnfABCDGE-type electron transport complex B subunit